MPITAVLLGSSVTSAKGGSMTPFTEIERAAPAEGTRQKTTVNTNNLFGDRLAEALEPELASLVCPGQA
jgi:hypothetical protein